MDCVNILRFAQGSARRSRNIGVSPSARERSGSGSGPVLGPIDRCRRLTRRDNRPQAAPPSTPHTHTLKMSAQDMAVGIIGMGEMGRMYAERLSQGGHNRSVTPTRPPLSDSPAANPRRDAPGSTSATCQRSLSSSRLTAKVRPSVLLLSEAVPMGGAGRSKASQANRSLVDSHRQARDRGHAGWAPSLARERLYHVLGRGRIP